MVRQTDGPRMSHHAIHALLWQMVSKREVYFGCGLRAEQFPEGPARQVFAKIGELYQSAREVDSFMLRAELPDYVYAWFSENVRDVVPSVANWRYYRDEVVRDYRARRAAEVFGEAQDRIGERDIIEWVMHELAQIEDAGTDDLVEQSQLIGRYVEEVEARWKANATIPGISTGIPKLDDMMLGLNKRRLILIGARPNDGKTALMTTLVANISRTGTRCGIISLESSKWELTERIVANIGSIENTRLATGRLDETERQRFAEAAERIHSGDWGVTISDNPYLSIDGVRARIREMVVAHGASVVFLDYVQRIRQTDHSIPFRLHIAECSRELKSLAEELQIPIVALAQLGRPAEGVQPQLSHFKEAGDLEQDADTAMLLWPREEGIALKIAKNRDGRKGIVPLTFTGPYMRFTEAE